MAVIKQTIADEVPFGPAVDEDIQDNAKTILGTFRDGFDTNGIGPGSPKWGRSPRSSDPTATLGRSSNG